MLTALRVCEACRAGGPCGKSLSDLLPRSAEEKSDSKNLGDGVDFGVDKFVLTLWSD
jgi:hypothetical protein